MSRRMSLLDQMQVLAQEQLDEEDEDEELGGRRRGPPATIQEVTESDDRDEEEEDAYADFGAMENSEGGSADDEFEDDDDDDDDGELFAVDEDDYEEEEEGETTSMRGEEETESSMDTEGLHGDQLTPLPPSRNIIQIGDAGMSPLQPVYEDDSTGNFEASNLSSASLYEEGYYGPDDRSPNDERRRSVSSIRNSIRSSINSSEADMSVSSAPVVSSERSASIGRSRQPRRVTITVPKENSPTEGTPMGASSRRRQNLFRASTAQDTGSSSGLSSMTESIRSSTSVFRPRRSSQRRSTRRSGTVGFSSDDISAAAERLGSADQNSEWENAAAAAAVVAASTTAPSKRKLIQYGQGDPCLVMLSLLNVTDKLGDRSLRTIDPVNKHGYPRGEGKTEDEKNGPYSYVLCHVTKVHFDEDERYYTVVRLDTECEQRADPGWMEPIYSVQALEIAQQAARRTERSEAEKPSQHDKGKSLKERIRVPIQFVNEKLIPLYKRSRQAAKVLIANLLSGENGYNCRCRITCINLLVLCSAIYLFVEVITVGFLPSSWDYAMVILEL